jgi:antitoxin component of MazEF toxin-antitoxin module
MVEAKTITVTKWGGTLGVRLPKEFVSKTGITDKSKMQLKIVGNVIMLTVPDTQRRHIPLSERMEKALLDGSWDGEPSEITEEDREWLDMPSVGEEISW